MNRPSDIKQEDWDAMSPLKRIQFCVQEVSAGLAQPDHVASLEELRRMTLFVSQWCMQEDPDGRLVLATRDEEGNVITWATSAK